MSLASRGCERDVTGVALGSCNALTMRSGLPQCSGLTPPPATVVTQLGTPPLSQRASAALKKSLSITAGIVSKNVRLVVLVMACSRASLAPFVCVRHLMSCCEHVAFWHCRAAMLHRTLVIPSPLSYMSPRCNPGLHRLRSLVTFMLEECQVVIAAIIRSSGASSKWLAFAFF